MPCSSRAPFTARQLLQRRLATVLGPKKHSALNRVEAASLLPTEYWGSIEASIITNIALRLPYYNSTLKELQTIF